MKVHLLRHGQTSWNLEGRLQGQRNVGLNETGKQQIERFCRQTQYPYTLIVTSPLLRALQSAEICSGQLGLPLTVNSAFAERSFGVLEGMRKKDIRQQLHIEDVESLDNGFGVEPMQIFCGRLESGLRQLTQSHRSERILLVTHGSVIRLLMKMTSSLGRCLSEGVANGTQADQIIPNAHAVKMYLPQEGDDVSCHFQNGLSV